MPITSVPSSSVDPVAQVVAALEAATATLAAAALTLADKGSWVTSTSYAVGDVVTQGGQRYCCRTGHTSGTFATDLAASKWVSLDAVAAATSARQITAGTGLTGGGDLSADRTLAVSYGTTSGTAAQGNDSRITGALQAANNLSDVVSAPAGRTALGLGTAAVISSTAGGDLSGTLPSPTVAKVNGIAVSGTPSSGYLLTATGSSAATWQAAANSLTEANAWITSTAYASAAVVTQFNQRYVSTVAHTSGTWTTDLAAGKWILLGNAGADVNTLGSFVPASWGTAWRAARAASGSSLARIVASGSSVTRGAFASDMNSTDFISLLRSALQTKYGDGGSGFASPEEARNVNGANGSRVAYTSSWTLNGNAVDNQAQSMASSSSAGATMTFTVRGATINLWTLRNAAYGTITYAVDGGGATTLALTTGSNVPTSLTIASGLSNTNHTVVVTVVSGTVWIVGVEGLNSAGVVVHNLGHSSAGSYTGSTMAWNGGVSYPCDLLIYEMNVNDAANSVVPDTWANSFRKVLDKMRVTGTYPEVILLAPNIGKWESANEYYSDYCARAVGICQAFGVAFINLWGYYRNSWDYFNSLSGWSTGAWGVGAAGSDTIHPGNTGHALYYSALNTLLPQLVN